MIFGSELTKDSFSSLGMETRAVLSAADFTGSALPPELLQAEMARTLTEAKRRAFIDFIRATFFMQMIGTGFIDSPSRSSHSSN
ncbi:hypothetical protein ACF08O_08885 [Streptomyces paradoxus]|uniref:hypothetical protein n=1 Tax=Streptomyces paradoxus TaxID=66375 RepID=UPI0036F836BA